MKSSGTVIRIFAIILFVSLVAVLLGNYALSAVEQEDSLDKLKERIEKHEDSHSIWDDTDNCSTCESYQEDLGRYERNQTQLILSVVQYVLIYSVFCVILYGIGEILTKISNTPVQQATPAQPMIAAPVQPAAVAPVQPDVSFCPNCGIQQLPGSRFCAVCGNIVEN